VKEYLDLLKVPYEEDHKLVRGLDYYTHTVWEFVDNT
jgi:histidyl-tRNA synthetase